MKITYGFIVLALASVPCHGFGPFDPTPEQEQEEKNFKQIECFFADGSAIKEKVMSVAEDPIDLACKFSRVALIEPLKRLGFPLKPEHMAYLSKNMLSLISWIQDLGHSSSESNEEPLINRRMFFKELLRYSPPRMVLEQGTQFFNDVGFDVKPIRAPAMLAFLMASHARTGATSSARVLNPFLYQEIAEWLPCIEIKDLWEKQPLKDIVLKLPKVPNPW